MNLNVHMLFKDRVGIVAEVAALIAAQQMNIVSMEVVREQDKARLWFETEPRAGVIFNPDSILGLLGELSGLREIGLVETLPQEERERRFRVVLDNISDGVVSIDSEGRITTINKGAQALLNCQAADAVGRHISDFHPPLTAIFKCLQGHRFNNIKKTIISDNGRFQYFSTGRPIYDACGRIVGAVEIFRDMKEIQLMVQSISRPRCITFSDFIGNSPGIRDAIAFAQRIAKTDAIISIRGESGTGKEWFARAIHAESGRKGLFVPINCAALPAHLLESELFGYESGAFTGAKKEGKSGLFENAADGTVFLDEIGEMEPVLQAKILRLIQERSIRRIGGSREIAVNARIITATNKNLEQMVTDNLFREDLYYRINVLPVHIPPLRERAEDILPLVEYFLFQLMSGLNYKGRGISSAAIEKLHIHSWPGNVRELKNVIERAAILCDADRIDIEHVLFSFEIGKNVAEFKNRQIPKASISGSLKSQINAFEKQIIQEIVGHCRSIRQAARRLGISHTTLLNKMKKYKIGIN